MKVKKMQTKSRFRVKIEKRDAAIYDEYINCINCGIAKTIIYENLARKYRVTAIATIFYVVQREKKRRELKELETLKNNENK